MFGDTVLVSDLQTNVAVNGDKISGQLSYISTGTLARDCGAGYFLALKFTNFPAGATSVKVGLQPSAGTGLVEVINDPDKNGVFKISSTTQSFMVVTTDGNTTRSQAYDLSGLELEDTGA